jgi:hypothetical protein
MDDRHDAETHAAGEWLTPWDTYDPFLRRARAARSRLLYNTLLGCADRLRERVCATAQRLHITLCPLCCH